MAYTGLISHNPQDTIKAMHNAIDQDGEHFDNPEARLAFLYVAIADIAGEEKLDPKGFLAEKFKEFGGQTLPEAVVNGEKETLKSAISLVVQRFSQTPRVF